MSHTLPQDVLSPSDIFIPRHIGPSDADIQKMLALLGYRSLAELIDATVPASIRLNRRLDLGPPRAETAQRALAGVGYLGGIRPGDWVSLHWDWVCDRLTARQLRSLRYNTLRQLEITNRTIGHNPVGTVLER